ncbi:ATP-binding cassette domain-containing protein [Micromonospora sp. NPDC049044]|uniref:ATP-binding cassette domain-containing protein n=1 Tax=unclassified Micromonospora TaxID=2617518 RepID=UPI003405F8BD
MSGYTEDYAIEVEGLRKAYPGHEALRGIDLKVPSGTVLGLLGPNGAGKTTTVRILATLLAPTAGRVRVAGYDVVRTPREVRRSIGLAGQYAAVDEVLTGRENLVLIGTLLHLGRAGARRRADELLERFGLTEASGRPAGTYSGGMRRRLDLASCMVGQPKVLFLDEPTTGVDPANRLGLWEAVRGLVAEGTTVLLTTQYLEEADALADRIVVIDGGRVAAEGTAKELKARVGGQRLEIGLTDPAAIPRATALLREVAVGEILTDERQGTVSLETDGGLDGLSATVARLRAHGIDVSEFALRRPTLDEVFLHLTGDSAHEPAGV